MDQSIHDHYVKTPDTWLLYLGGSQDRIALSASLDFFRSLSRTFLDTVARYPEIEAVRHRADLACDPETINRFVDAAPLMIGREYLTRDLLVHIWEQLTHTFVHGIQAYPGSVTDFFKDLCPHIHLAGRVYFHMDALLDFNALLMIGDDPITPEEATAILSQSAGLAWIKNRWVEVDTQRLEQVLAAYEQAMEMVEEGTLTLKDALLLQLHPERFQLTENLTDLSFAHGDWLNTVVKQLSNPEQVRTATAPKAFRATLRPYQQVGLNWLSFLDSMKFGACLADDMGLGKTLQVLGMLSLFQKREPDSMSMLIVPASLIANWEQEIQRFLPGLAYAVAHPGSADTGLKKGSRPPDPADPALYF